MDVSLLIAVVVVTALIFDFTNGFHDTANSVATSIATGALRPKVAVALSAFLNLVGAFLSIKVAQTIAGDLVDDTMIGPHVIFGGLVGAILWNLITWFIGLPSSSSHALFGGLIGATWVAAGSDAINFVKILQKILLPAIAAPLIAGLVAAGATYLTYKIANRVGRRKADSGFRLGQIVSASAVSLAHGTNDAQKTMGIITLTLISANLLPAGSGPPVWVIVSAAAAIALGTYLGGWRIIHTLGKGLTELEGPQGFAAQTSSATVILVSSQLGLPLSTTHVCSGGIVGSSLGRRDAFVRWSLATRMVGAWFLTLPAAGVVGALAGGLASINSIGVVLVAAMGLTVAGVLWFLSRRGDKHPHHVVEELSVAAARARAAA